MRSFYTNRCWTHWLKQQIQAISFHPTMAEQLIAISYVIVDSGRYIYTTFLCVRLVNQLVVAFYSSACFGDKNWLQSQIAAGNYRTAPLHKIITITQTQRQVTCCEMLFSCNKLLEGPVQRVLRANCKSFSFIKWNCRSGFIMGCKILGLTVNQ